MKAYSPEASPCCGESARLRTAADSPTEKVVFLQGMRVRSGTNFVSRFVSYHPRIRLIPADETKGEFRLMTSTPAWRTALDELAQLSFGMPSSVFNFSQYGPYFGRSWLEYLNDQHLEEGKVLFLKDPSVRNLDLFPQIFPGCKLIVLTRDGRDNVASCVRAARAVRRSTTVRQRSKAMLNHLSLRSFVGFSRTWVEAARNILRFERELAESPVAGNYLRIRFEDLYLDPVATGRRLFNFMGVECTDHILEEAAGAPVVGSSFYSPRHVEDSTKPNWKPTRKTQHFQPVGRWKSWGGIRRSIFKSIAGEELIALGYENSHDW